MWGVKACDSGSGSMDGKWVKKDMKGVMQAVAPKAYLASSEVEAKVNAVVDTVYTQAKAAKNHAGTVTKTHVQNTFGTCFPQSDSSDTVASN